MTKSNDMVERDGTDFIVPAELIGAAFDIEPAQVPDLMRGGKMTSRCETGIDADAGRWRITIYFNGRALRLTVDEAGNILSQSAFDSPRPGSQRNS